jgi:hypothetical protein
MNGNTLLIGRIEQTEAKLQNAINQMRSVGGSALSELEGIQKTLVAQKEGLLGNTGKPLNPAKAEEITKTLALANKQSTNLVLNQNQALKNLAFLAFIGVAGFLVYKSIKKKK